LVRITRSMLICNGAIDVRTDHGRRWYGTCYIATYTEQRKTFSA
jgi:hypothetical protein